MSITYLNQQIKTLPNKGTMTFSGCNDAAICLIIVRHITEVPHNIILSLSSHADMHRYKEMIKFFDPNVSIILFPPWDCLPYDRVSPSPEIISMRIAGLKQIKHHQANNKPFILLTTASALLQKIRKIEVIEKASVTATPNKRVPIDRLSRFLVTNGYTRTSTVREAGEFAVRGGIFDLFPTGYQQPVRLDFFGDVIEKMKLFDPMTQISSEEIKQLELTPISEILLDKKTISQFKKAYHLFDNEAIHANNTLYHNISKGIHVQGMEAYLPLFDPDLTHLLELLPEASLYSDSYAPMSQEEFWNDIQDYYTNRKGAQKVLPPEELYIMRDDWKQLLEHRAHYSFTPHHLPEKSDVIHCGFRTIHSFIAIRKNIQANLFEETIKIIQKAQKEKKIILIIFLSQGSRERICESFEEYGLSNFIFIDHFNASIEHAQGIFCSIAPILQGYETEDMLCLTEQDIFGEKSGRVRKKNKKADRMLFETQGFAVGDFIVHHDHGIGRYLGLEAITVNNVQHDCVLLEYHDGDKVYVPVENIDLLTRYGSEGSEGVLDRLGSAAWQGRKARLKKKLDDIAEHLIEVAAQRTLKQGEKIIPIDDLYQDFCARFPYEETDDQLSAIEAVIEDMGSGRPMDRLICGDVGFGKTEVAIRAAYIAAAAGIQTALIVPTTLLARQHYKHFKERFEGQPFKVGCLSRMVSAKEINATRAGLEDGSVDIVIGTHAILSASTQFKNLGLLIIDEEQHFGVTHKEKLKKLKSNIHILTLTATPIPRTLQMSMTGVRDLSIIATPPVDRLAIRTYVASFDIDMMREALLREKYRGGQAFFVVPRVKDIEEVSDFLRRYVPEVSFITGHGQMPAKELDAVMNDFYDRQYDILLATTIIESGIDIPTANTMIIWRADMFGLAQLYQIRGRIGRSNLRSYAYLTTKPKQILSKTAEKRLRILETLDHLGAGFTLASHDMDLRGAGNLLGSQQSGHIKEVGFELYQSMLEEALTKMKSDTQEKNDLAEGNHSPQINIGLSAIIPQTYVEDLSVRLGLYRRIADLKDREDIDAFAAELIDRFGKMPIDVKNLLFIIELKTYCKKAYISKLEAGDKGMLLTFHNDYFPEPEKLLEWVSQHDYITIRPDHRLAIKKNMPEVKDKYRMSLHFLKKIIEIL